MLGHYHITDNKKFHFIASFTQFSDENISCPRALQQRQTAVTAKRNKIEMAFSVVALQSPRHRKLHRKKLQPQDPRTTHRNPGHPQPLALFTFASIAAVISSLSFPCQH